MQVDVSSCGGADEQQLRLLESWLELSLENSSVDLDDPGSIGDDDSSLPACSSAMPRVIPNAGLERLHAHAQEAAKQASDSGSSASSDFVRTLEECQRTWDLCVALWGRLEEQDLFAYGQDSHQVTMLRKEALSRWLSKAVAPMAEADVSAAVLKKDAMGEMLALLSGNKFAEACQRAQVSSHSVLIIVKKCVELK